MEVQENNASQDHGNESVNSQTEETSNQEESQQQADSSNDNQDKSAQEKQKLLDELMSYKKKAREYETQLKSVKDNQLKAQENWKEYALNKEKEAQEATERYENARQSIVDDKVFSSLKDDARKMGIRDEALSDLELLDWKEKIMIEQTDTGRVNVLGTKSYIEQLKNSKPHWFKSGKSAISTDNPEVVSNQSATVDLDTLMNLKKKYKESGDKKDYESYLSAYNNYLKRR